MSEKICIFCCVLLRCSFCFRLKRFVFWRVSCKFCTLLTSKGRVGERQKGKGENSEEKLDKEELKVGQSEVFGQFRKLKKIDL